MRPYLIVSPHFAQQCGGIKALHRLCHLLNAAGYEAYITGNPAPFYEPGFGKAVKLPTLSLEKAREFQQNGIVVYPDIIPGNPLCFNTVVRWWLGITMPAPEHELIFSYAKSQERFGKGQHTLRLFYIEDFFNDIRETKRIRPCFYRGKGTSIPVIPDVSSIVEITKQRPQTRLELAKLFKQSTVFYTCDDLSVLNIESRLCGCPVILLGYTNVDKTFYNTDLSSSYAMLLPEDKGKDVSLLYEEIPLFKKAYLNMCEHSYKEFENFCIVTQETHSSYTPNITTHASLDWLPINIFPRRE